ncbi:gastrula zinc finger protein XlCGF7.1 [Folsomia candida]|uniref:Zinc finger imprinted 3 n=1 Tax=Folsomia candida TaxID=158441 RepID=A0A226DNR2_FOLCA|nr:gastrula zinc finger protein XlCGF7.1 [Folsomia candida]XP_035712470.1 gastrula zinc finger protein XlCGF7.1 [Folsomia candida]XP_035712471.1 gastrula zinc finger protein XlCGF7.1 [Folsomia candida]XP_035712472.1 gastrula zinc finger protein XlCGF7.1 [Folsomia candida]OXA47175.1 Zinc finger imprinted 3 [Folsomia candida]
MVTHDPDALVKCEICGMTSKNRVALNAHVFRFHSNRKRPSCDACHRVFLNSANLRQHIKNVHSTVERPRFPCWYPGCEKSYKFKQDVSKHVKAEHAENPVRFTCTLCEKEFKTRGDLESHIHTHTTEKPFKCATCGRRFSHKSNMKSHETTHLEKSARNVSKCHLCPQTFLTRIGLQLHIRILHENRRNYPCAFCNERFSRSSNLKRHVEAKHGANKELIHSCDKCEYESKSKQNLARHKARHEAGNRGCYFCGKKFVTFYELVKHCRVHTLEA